MPKEDRAGLALALADFLRQDPTAPKNAARHSETVDLGCR
jgi:hypothetical protein